MRFFSRRRRYWWRYEYGFSGSTPTLWGWSETFEAAVQDVREIEWGFVAADGGVPDLERTYDLTETDQSRLAAWLDELEQDPDASTRDVHLIWLDPGFYTNPETGGPVKRNLGISIRKLSRSEAPLVDAS